MRHVAKGGHLDVDARLARLTRDQYEEWEAFWELGDPLERILNCLGNIGVLLASPPEEIKGKAAIKKWGAELHADLTGSSKPRPKATETPGEPKMVNPSVLSTLIRLSHPGIK